MLVSVGCGDAKNKGPLFDLAPVAGTVTLDGQPLADADVAFYLEGAAVPGYFGSGGKTDAQGRYELQTGAAKGALPGAFKVTVSRITDAKGGPLVLSDGMDVQQLKVQGEAKESLPGKYSDMEKTELSTTVDKSKAEGYDFDLRRS
jgi:hypothetical protein